MTEGATPNGRDRDGRFVPGNPGGPGGARQRTIALREAAESAVTPEHVGALMRRATRMGLEGNLTALRFVIERACGRPADVSTAAEPLDFALPSMKTAKECNAALEEVATGLTEGRMNLDTARILVELIAARVKGIEVMEVEQRLIELEKQFDAIEPASRRR